MSTAPMPSAAGAGAPAAIAALAGALRRQDYLCDQRLATACHLALALGRPLLLEGEPGVGKTELAKALSRALGRTLVRLQCYDGLEQREALYEWNYTAQLLHMRAAQAVGIADSVEHLEAGLYDDRFLVRRPLLQALQCPAPGALLLIDEVDRADEPFEAFLLEFLGEYQVTIPELGRVAAELPPLVILTSNRTRDLGDALRRRCLYHWLDFPDRERELAILHARVPQASAVLAAQVAGFVQRLRSAEAARFERLPGVAESVEWARALVALDALALDPELARDTAGALFKHREDVAQLTADFAASVLAEVSHAAG